MVAVPESPAAGTGVLAELVAARWEAEAAERRVLRLIVAYAAGHAVAGIGEPGVGGHEEMVELAGAGAPGVAEFAIADVAAALGLSTVSARRLVGQALEIRHRLPRVWALVCADATDTTDTADVTDTAETTRTDEPDRSGGSGRGSHAPRRVGVVAWRARMVAERTVLLSSAQAAYVDAQVAPVIDKIGPGRLLRIVEAARILTETPATPPTPDPLEESAQPHDLHPRDQRGPVGAALAGQGVEVRVDTRAAAHCGVGYLDGCLEAGDALDLQAAIQAAAATLRAPGPRDGTHGEEDSLEVRRARALGVIARHYLATAPGAGTTTTGTTTGGTGAGGTGAGGVRLVVHYRPGSDAAAAGLAGLENTQGLVSVEQIAGWCRRQGATVRIQPVIDLAEDLTAGGYVPGPRLRTQIEERDKTCVFPHCVTAATRADLDHTIHYRHGPTAPAAQTRSTNLAALCRFHHRLKTHHSGWTYHHLAPGWYHWHAPEGRHYLRGPTGTIDITGQ